MVACVCPSIGLFLRINSKGWRKGSVLLPLSLHKTFLCWDSYIECGAPFELDDYTVDQSIDEGGGIIGEIHTTVVDLVIAEISASNVVSADDIMSVCDCLRAACG